VISSYKPFALKSILFFSIYFIPVLDLRAQEGVWTDVFNGKDLTGLKKSGNGTVTVNTAEKLIDVSGGNGYLYTDAEYTHYRTRIEWKNIGGGNSGFLHHVDPTKNCASSWPPGPELQMMKGNVGDIWTTDCKFNSTILDAKYNSTGVKTTGIGNYGCSNRANFRGIGANEKIGDWNAWELFVKGDSLEVKVNGVVVMAFSKLTTTGNIPMTKGRMALQIEGSRVQWRNWQVMDLSIPLAIAPFSRQKVRSTQVLLGHKSEFSFTSQGLPKGAMVEVYSATGRKAIISTFVSKK
jgi:hypothetical protein